MSKEFRWRGGEGANFPWNGTYAGRGAGTGRHNGCLGAGTGAIWPLWTDRLKLIGAVAAGTNLAVGGECRRVVGIGIGLVIDE